MINKKSQVFYGLVDKPEEKKEVVPFEYDKKVAKSFTLVYNTKNKQYELITTVINVEKMTSESTITKMRSCDTKAKALYEIQKMYSEYIIKGDK
jgi:hypothetical protein